MSFLFPPTDDTITVLNLQEPGTNFVVLAALIFVFNLLTFAHWDRSFWGMFRSEYKTINKKSLADVAEKTYNRIPWYALQHCVAALFTTGWLIWTWVVYDYQLKNGTTPSDFRNPVDIGSIIITSIYGFLIVAFLVINIYHLYNVRIIMTPDPASPYALLQAKLLANPYYQNHYSGLNGQTTGSVRAAIFMLASLWGVGVPCALAGLVIANIQAVPVWEYALVGSALLGSAGAWIVWAFIKKGNLLIAYGNNVSDKGTKKHTPKMYSHFGDNNQDQPVHVGLASNVAGPNLWFKGLIPVLSTPWPIMASRIFSMTAYAIYAYQDQLQTLAFLVLCEVMALFFTVVAEDDAYFMIFEIMSTYFFIVFNYWSTAVIGYDDVQAKINFDLMNVHQNASIADPLDVWGFSIYVYTILAVVASGVALLYATFVEPMVKAADEKIEL